MLADAWQSFQTLQQPVLGPHSPFNLIHSIRIGYVLRVVQKQIDGPVKRMSTPQVLALSWFCMFGSLTLAQVLLGQSALWLASPGAQVAYVLPMSIILLNDSVFGLVDAIPWQLRAILEVLIDGTSRIGGLTDLGIDLVRRHPEKALRNPFAMIFIATLVAGGGDLLLPSFNMLSVDWKPTTPPFAKGNFSPDLWSCPLIAAFYASLTHAHPFFAQYSPYDKPWASDDAKAASAVLLVTVLGLARFSAWLRTTPPVKEKEVAVKKKSQ